MGRVGLKGRVGLMVRLTIENLKPKGGGCIYKKTIEGGNPMLNPHLRRCLY